MTKYFTAPEMSTIWDICLNTYGDLNYIAKLMVDNNFLGVNTYPTAGQIFSYDDTLVRGLAIQKNNTVKYATNERTSG